MIGGFDLTSASAPEPLACTLWTRQRTEIRDWLDKHAPPLAETYSGIVELLFAGSLPGRGRLIAHGVREIGNNLVRFVASPADGRVQYEQLTTAVLKEWRDHGLPVGDEPPPAPLDGTLGSGITPIPRIIVVKIAELLGEHEAGTSRARQKFESLYTALNAEQPSCATLKPVVDRWRGVCNWFVARVHHNSKMDAEVLTEEFRLQFKVFEELLHAMSAPFFAVLDDIDEILAEANR